MLEEENLFNRLLEEFIAQTISNRNQELLFSMILNSDIYRERYEKAVRLNTLLHIPYFKSQKEKDFFALTYSIQNNKRKRRGSSYRLFFKPAVAAILLTIVSLSSIFIYKAVEQHKPSSIIEASTPLGGQSKIILPDGSTAWINSKSTLRYNSTFGETERRLYLEGEGYFEVHKDNKLPFSVYAGKLEIIATGTVFNVRSYKDDEKWEINLLEGGVDVLVDNQSYTLHPNEKVVYYKNTAQVTIEQTEAQRASLWTKGRLSFYQASIPDIYKMLERHFNVKIEIISEELKREYFMGSINLDMNLIDILNYLDVNRKYKIEINNDLIIIRDK